MIRYIARRVAYMLVTLFVIISVTFFISKALPGTPFADDKLTPQTRAQLFEKYGLDEPFYVQYGKYMWQRGARRPGQLFLLREQAGDADDPSATAGLRVHRDSGGHLRGGRGAATGDRCCPSTQHPLGHLGGGGGSARRIRADLRSGTALTVQVFGVRLGWFPIAFFESWMHSVLAFAGPLGLRYLRQSRASSARRCWRFWGRTTSPWRKPRALEQHRGDQSGTCCATP